MKRSGSIAAVVVAIVLFALAGRLNSQLGRTSQGPAEQTALHGAPPGVLFATILLGGFRGLLADALWLRGSYLQDQGRYFELMQIADWITHLEPQAAEVWTFHAWNIAYNVSVMMPEPDERWRWVLNGVELLRDGAIRANPDSGRLYAELAWLFQHKIGAEYDPAHPVYKLRWAATVDSVLPGGSMGAPPGEAESRQDAAVRRVLKMNPALMREIDAACGAFDWRVPQAHAVYWAWLGRRVSPGTAVRARCDRLMYQNLVRLFFAGTLTVPRVGDQWEGLAPRPDLLTAVRTAFESALNSQPDDPNIATAYRAFLGSAVCYLHAARDPMGAEQLYNELRENAGPGAALPETASAFVSMPEVLASLPPYVREAVDTARREQRREKP